MIDIIEKAFDVYINHKIQMLYLHHFHALGDCVLCRPVWAKAIASIVEFGLAARLQNL